MNDEYTVPPNLSSNEKINFFNIKQKQPYDFKVRYAEIRAWEFYDECHKRGKNCYVSVGGLDSITLLCFLRKIGLDLPAVSISSLEDRSIQKIHKELGVISLKPLKSKIEVIKEYGYPIISKKVAQAISYLQNPTEGNLHTRQKIYNEAKNFGNSNFKSIVPLKWLQKFGGVDPIGQALGYQAAPFKVSDQCCYFLKEKPCLDYERENNAAPYLGLMASEGGRREIALKINGCNYFGKKRYRSCPFAIFSRQDLLQLAIDLNVHVPEIYGEIKKDEFGSLYTTKAQRSGCGMCGFGVHLHPRPHQFDLLYKENPKAWEFWIIQQGWGEVLDYIEVEWREPEKLNFDITNQKEINTFMNKTLCVIDNQNFSSFADAARYCGVSRQAAQQSYRRNGKTLGGKSIIWANQSQ